jgi:hypothetical protein
VVLPDRDGLRVGGDRVLVAGVPRQFGVDRDRVISCRRVEVIIGNERRAAGLSRDICPREHRKQPLVELPNHLVATAPIDGPVLVLFFGVLRTEFRVIERIL